MPAETVLVEIVTAANMAGVEKAQAGMLGLSATTLGLAAVMGVVVVTGKAAIENYNAQKNATAGLEQATHAYNATAGTTIKVVAETAAQISKAADTSSKAADSLTIAQNAAAKAQSAYTAAVHAHGVKSDQAKIAATNLQDATIRLKTAQDAAKDAADALALAQEKTTTQVYHQGIRIDELKAAYENFKQTNKQFIANQYDTENALATVVRSGENEKDAMRILGDALDLAVIKHENVSEAGAALVKVLAGNSKALKELGITTEQYAAIMHDKTLTVEEQHSALLTLIETKTAKGRTTVDSMQLSQNRLNMDWQDFTARIGPAVVGTLDAILTAADRGIQIIDLLATGIDRIRHSSFGQIANAGQQFSTQSVLGAIFGRAGGGPVGAGQAYTVGEQGPETLVMGNQGGNIVPNGAGGTTEIHIHIDQGAYIDGPGIDMLTNRIAQRLRFVSGT